MSSSNKSVLIVAVLAAEDACGNRSCSNSVTDILQKVRRLIHVHLALYEQKPVLTHCASSYMYTAKPLIGETDDALMHRSEICTQKFVQREVSKAQAQPGLYSIDRHHPEYAHNILLHLWHVPVAQRVAAPQLLLMAAIYAAAAAAAVVGSSVRHA
eukprot:18115-Heterococcus_DN1.PRE.6